MIIGISGRKQGGKTFAAKYMEEQIHGATRIGFADELKEIVLRCFVPANWGITLKSLDYEDTKNIVTPSGFTVRELLQKVGTDFFRSTYSDVWITAYHNRLSSVFDKFPIVITPDVRFPNEVSFIQQCGGVVIRLTRAPFSEDMHESEVALDPAFMATIHQWGAGEFGKKNLDSAYRDVYNTWAENPVKFDYVFHNADKSEEEHKTMIDNWLGTHFRRVRMGK